MKRILTLQFFIGCQFCINIYQMSQSRVMRNIKFEYLNLILFIILLNCLSCILILLYYIIMLLYTRKLQVLVRFKLRRFLVAPSV